MNIQIEDLASTIMAELERYSDDVDEVVKEVIDEVADDTVDNLLNNNDIPIKTGKYKRGFRKTTVAEGKGYKRVKVNNKRHQLTDLLEHGHVTRNGTSRSKAFPHWAEAAKIVDTLDKRVEERLEGLN